MIRIALLAALTAGGAQAADVRDAAGLRAALAAARGGETIRLSAGDYGRLALRGAQFAPAVTLKSVTPGAARFDRMTLSGVRGLTFDGIELVHRLQPGENTRTRGIDIVGGGDIGIVNSVLGGTPDGDPLNDGHGLHVRGADGVRIERNRFHNLFRGAVVSRSRDIGITDNTLHDMRSDGLNFEGVSQVVIARNSCRDFYFNKAQDDHPDCIQIWAQTGGPSSDVEIRDNVVLQGKGGMMQGIFVRSERGERHRNIRIENNLYHSAMLNGVTLSGTDGGTVKGNTVVSFPGQPQRAAIRLSKLTGVSVRDNIACVFVRRDESPIDFENNLLVNCQGKGEGPRAERVFRGPLGSAATLAAFAVDWRAAGLRPGAAGFAARP